MQESPTAEIQTIQHGPEARVTGAMHMDPMPVGKLGMWLFLASEAMFFVGLLSAFIVLESAGSQHELFVKSSHMLNKWLGGASIFALAFSSLALLDFPRKFTWIAVSMASAFMFLQLCQWNWLTDTHTIVAWKDGRQIVVNGSEESDETGIAIEDDEMPLRDGFDIHAMTEADFPGSWRSWMKVPPTKDVIQDANYGPSRNNFFACYFLMTAAHVLHLLAGLIAMLWFMLFAKRKIPQPVQIYWHFVNAVGVLTFVTLYFA